MKSLLVVAAAAAVGFAACAAPTEDAASTQDALGAVHAEGWFELRPDLRRCVSPVCGGVFVRLLNEATTTCVNGDALDSCYVARVDASSLHLPEAVASQIARGGSVVVKGQLRDQAYDQFGNLGTLKVTEAYVAGDADGPDAARSRFYFVKQEHVECIVAPCPERYQVTALNASADASSVAALDLDKAALSNDEADLVKEAAAEGIIVLGRSNESALIASKYFVEATAASAIRGTWGADGAILTVASGRGRIELSCGSASIDSIRFAADGASFTAHGSHLAGSGVAAADHAAQPSPATFRGTVSGDTIALTMNVNGTTTSLTFTKGREVNLIRCL